MKIRHGLILEPADAVSHLSSSGSSKGHTFQGVTNQLRVLAQFGEKSKIYRMLPWCVLHIARLWMPVVSGSSISINSPPWCLEQVATTMSQEFMATEDGISWQFTALSFSGWWLSFVPPAPPAGCFLAPVPLVLPPPGISVQQAQPKIKAIKGQNMPSRMGFANTYAVT